MPKRSSAQSIIAVFKRGLHETVRTELPTAFKLYSFTVHRKENIELPILKPLTSTTCEDKDLFDEPQFCSTELDNDISRGRRSLSARWKRLMVRFKDHDGVFHMVSNYFLNVFSGHGMVHWFVPWGWNRRIFWVSVNLFFAYHMAWHSLLAVQGYMSSPKTVSMTVSMLLSILSLHFPLTLSTADHIADLQAVHQGWVQFPAVTVCNMNMFSRSRLTHHMEHNGSVFPDKFKYILNVASWAEAAYKRSKEGKLFPMPVHSYADISLHVLQLPHVCWTNYASISGYWLHRVESARNSSKDCYFLGNVGKALRLTQPENVHTFLEPSVHEIQSYGVRGKDFIISCSFDGIACSYKYEMYIKRFQFDGLRALV